ncbi:sulfotransferase [Myceligenerans crystallogenes]|uniref:Sulfotransferase n=1 Tax=Myceligenerans crystallogenes TaxID=316335 RepID=A0ABN2N288_9MICO
MKRTSRTASVLNTLVRPLVKGPEDPAGAWAKACAEAEEEIGYRDPAFTEGFRVLLESSAAQPNLAPLGWVFTLGELTTRYTNRLRVLKVLTEHPEVADEPIKAPVFVCGLPRTATTLTHRVLAMAPAHRGPLSWEMKNIGLAEPGVEKKMIASVNQESRITGVLIPALAHQHPSGPTVPEESMMVLPHGLYWEVLHGDLPGYRAWLREHDMVPDYVYLKQALQVLQHGRPRKRWILKYPGHVAEMAQAREVFPDATFVWTHRDPTTVIGSACSLSETLWGLYQTSPDLAAIGRKNMDIFSTWIEQGLESRLSLPASAIVDVPYHRLSADPYAEVPRLYQAIGARWTVDDEANLAAVLAKPKKARPHRYELARYGLDEVEVARRFETYTRLLDHIDEREAPPVTDF